MMRGIYSDITYLMR